MGQADCTDDGFATAHFFLSTDCTDDGFATAHFFLVVLWNMWSLWIGFIDSLALIKFFCPPRYASLWGRRIARMMDSLPLIYFFVHPDTLRYGAGGLHG